MAASKRAGMNGLTLVTGATGVLGSAILAELAARDLPARGLSRSEKPAQVFADWTSLDLLKSEDLREALDGAGSIIHCASDPRRPKDDMVALGQLMRAAKAVGSPHLVFVGIAGIERSAPHFPYYRLKLEAEHRLRAEYPASSVVRVTQFHPLVAFLLRRLDAKIAVVVPRGAQLQPVDVDFVASQLVDTALTRSTSRVPDVHGPETISMKELARTWLQVRHRQTPVVSIPTPFQPLKALSAIETVSGNAGGISWNTWIAEHTGDDAYARR